MVPDVAVEVRDSRGGIDRGPGPDAARSDLRFGLRLPRRTKRVRTRARVRIGPGRGGAGRPRRHRRDPHRPRRGRPVDPAQRRRAAPVRSPCRRTSSGMSCWCAGRRRERAPETDYIVRGVARRGRGLGGAHDHAGRSAEREQRRWRRGWRSRALRPGRALIQIVAVDGLFTTRPPIPSRSRFRIARRASPSSGRARAAYC